MAFARYIVGLEHETPWSLETVEIDASLPKLGKQGRLRAIRRLLPLGRPEYQVLEIAGDQTVSEQVIVRYLSAQVQAAAIPASSVCDYSCELQVPLQGCREDWWDHSLCLSHHAAQEMGGPHQMRIVA